MCVCVSECLCVCVCGGEIYVGVHVFISGVGLGCFFALGSYCFTGYFLTFRILNSFGLALIYGTI